MLQGSSFEAELVVRDRTTSVRQALEYERPLFETEHLVNLRRWWQSVFSAIRRIGSSLQKLEPVKDQK